MIDIQCVAADISQGKKEDRKKPKGKNIISTSATQGGHKNQSEAWSPYIKSNLEMDHDCSNSHGTLHGIYFPFSPFKAQICPLTRWYFF